MSSLLESKTFIDDMLKNEGNRVPGTKEQNFLNNEANYIPISQFYAGRSVFVTGGTGFMGQVLLEKLLRSCPDIKNIYLLIRPKSNQNISDRLDKLLNTPLFETLRKKNMKILSKIKPIPGDVTLEELGISKDDQALLCGTVSIVFHTAATVKFDEKLKLSVTINMLGTKRLVELCKRMSSLDALIHVSTAYCNCDRNDVSEIVYSVPFNPNDIITLIKLLPEDMLDQLTPILIGNRPNTYTFTKALAEHILLKEAVQLPVAIVRPSIVVASLKEPFPGWVNNLNGPTGIISAVSKGLMRTMIVGESLVADLIPVDIVINLMITAAWRTATVKQDKLTIYNCCSAQRNPITWGTFLKHSMKYIQKYPLEGCIYYPTAAMRMNKTMNQCHGFLVHYIPAYIFDVLARLLGKKPFMMTIQKKLAKGVECLEYFTTHQWIFRDDNVRMLLNKLSQNDREAFMFDVAAINWEKSVERFVLGFREFLFKQRPESIPSCRKTMKRLYYIHQLVKIASLYVVWRYLICRSKKVNSFRLIFLQNVIKIARLIPFFNDSFN